MATGTRRTGAVIFTVTTIFSDFCSPGVRSNARKKFKFEFLKFFTLGGQHIRQGCQRYFCYKERLSFAEIIFQILVLSLFQIQSLADVCVELHFEFWFETSWLS
jgi:hypothetical protein